jgi:hypothetical protein
MFWSIVDWAAYSFGCCPGCCLVDGVGEFVSVFAKVATKRFLLIFIVTNRRQFLTSLRNAIKV